MAAMTDEPVVVETDVGWTLPLVGRRVTQCAVDFAFTLDFWVRGPQSAFVKIESRFTLGDANGAIECNPEDTMSVAPALKLFQREIRSAVVSRSGILALVFSDGQWIRVPPDADYEAWEARMEDETLLVCMPGGDVAVFSAPSKAPSSTVDAGARRDLVLVKEPENESVSGSLARRRKR
jgi:hypothetical protein